MAINPTKKLLTYDDYALLPDDGKRYELIDGELSATENRAPAAPSEGKIRPQQEFARLLSRRQGKLKIVLGESRRSKLKALFGAPTLDEILDHTANIDIVIVSRHVGPEEDT